MCDSAFGSPAADHETSPRQLHHRHTHRLVEPAKNPDGLEEVLFGGIELTELDAGVPQIVLNDRDRLLVDFVRDLEEAKTGFPHFVKAPESVQQYPFDDAALQQAARIAVRAEYAAALVKKLEGLGRNDRLPAGPSPGRSG